MYIENNASNDHKHIDVDAEYILMIMPPNDHEYVDIGTQHLLIIVLLHNNGYIHIYFNIYVDNDAAT